ALARNYGSQDLDTVWTGFTGAAELTGERLAGFLKAELGRGLSMTFMANQVPMKENRISLHPTVRDKWDRPAAYVNKGWHPHDVALMQTYAGVCGGILRAAGLADVGQGGVYGTNNIARCANHILGGARFGRDSKDSVLDRDCRAWGFDNLYVTDGSFMPTSG